MRATDLMIGDWVKCGRRYMKVTQLAEDMDCDDIDPIPLTTEILEKNGWKLHDDVFINKDENISNIIFSVSSKFILGGVFIIEYVHQLQQYLRLDEDIEFANNLKV